MSYIKPIEYQEGLFHKWPLETRAQALFGNIFGLFPPEGGQNVIVWKSIEHGERYDWEHQLRVTRESAEPMNPGTVTAEIINSFHGGLRFKWSSGIAEPPVMECVYPAFIPPLQIPLEDGDAKVNVNALVVMWRMEKAMRLAYSDDAVEVTAEAEPGEC